MAEVEPAGSAYDAGLEFVSAVSPNPFSEAWYEINATGHFWFEWRLAAALRQVRDLGLPLGEPLRVLDVGCGRGVLRDQIEAATAWVVDITDVHLEAVSRAHAGRGRRLYYDIRERRPEFREAYDVVMLFDVLEHLPEPRAFLSAVLDHLKPGGQLLMNVPAIESLRSVYDDAAGHLRRYDRPSLASELADLPCEVRDVRYWGLTLVPLLALRKLLLRRASASDTIQRGLQPPGALADRLLHALMRLETRLVKRPWLGTSVLLAGRKPVA